MRLKDDKKTAEKGKRVCPGKIVVFVGAIGHGNDAGDFYKNPDRHGLVGDSFQDMMNRCAKKWGWESGEALDIEVDRVQGNEHVPWRSDGDTSEG